ncbi:MAG: hypothetical protein WC989_03640 [Micavibrio sp.]
MKFTRLLFFVFFLYPAFSYAACVSPAGGESETRYDFSQHKMYYCNGMEWVGAGGGDGLKIGDTVSPASTTCPYGWMGGTVTLSPTDLIVFGGKVGLRYGGNAGAYVCTRDYNGSWAACNCVDTTPPPPWEGGH